MNKDELADKILKICEDTIPNHQLFSYDQVKDFARAYHKVKMADSEAKPQWISVHDELPKFKLFYVDNQLTMESSIDCYCYDGNEVWEDTYNSDFGFHNTVTHYQLRTLPKPPTS